MNRETLAQANKINKELEKWEEARKSFYWENKKWTEPSPDPEIDFVEHVAPGYEDTDITWTHHPEGWRKGDPIPRFVSKKSKITVKYEDFDSCTVEVDIPGVVSEKLEDEILKFIEENIDRLEKELAAL